MFSAHLDLVFCSHLLCLSTDLVDKHDIDVAGYELFVMYKQRTT